MGLQDDFSKYRHKKIKEKGLVNKLKSAAKDGVFSTDEEIDSLLRNGKLFLIIATPIVISLIFLVIPEKIRLLNLDNVLIFLLVMFIAIWAFPNGKR